MKFNRKHLVEIIVGVACVTVVIGTLNACKPPEAETTQVVTLQSIGTNQNGIYQVGEFMTYRVNPTKTMGEVAINVVDGERVQLAQDVRQLAIAEVPAEQYMLVVSQNGEYLFTKVLTQDELIDTIDKTPKEVEQIILAKEDK